MLRQRQMMVLVHRCCSYFTKDRRREQPSRRVAGSHCTVELLHGQSCYQMQQISDESYGIQ